MLNYKLVKRIRHEFYKFANEKRKLEISTFQQPNPRLYQVP